MKSCIPVPIIIALHKLGEDINDARRRRRITMKLLAERANISLVTLSRVQKGDPGTSIGAYAAVLFSLGMIGRLSDLADAAHDLTGRALEEERLPERVRIAKQRKAGDERDEE